MLDTAPVLDEQLLQLGRWIADYYLAPIGEVFRTMLPLGAEFKRASAYRITEEGQMALHLAGMSGSSARVAPHAGRASRRISRARLSGRTESALDGADLVREETLRSATRVSKLVLAGMVRKKWLAREDVPRRGTPRARSTIALLKSAEGKLNENQRTD